MKKCAYITLTLIMFFTVFCSRERWQGRIYKEQGVTVVESHGSGVLGGRINEKITFEETLSLGEEEGEEFLLFHSELDVAVDSESNIYILDGRNHRLLKFDKAGNFLWETGRKGQGPGEFRYPFRVAVSPSDTEIWILDSPSHIHVFDVHQGKYQRSMNLRGSWRNFQFLPDGRLLINKSTRGKMGFAAEYYSSDGELLEKFDEYRYGQELPEWAGGSIGGGGYQFLGNDIYMILPDKYEIRRYNLEGKLLEKIKRDFKLEPPSLQKFKNGFIMKASNVIGPCFLYKKRMLLNMLMLVEKKEEGEAELQFLLDFFNEKGQFLGSFKLLGYTSLNTIDSENNLYFVQQEPFPRVIRSTLNID